MVFGRMFSHKGLKGPGDIPPKVLAYIEKHAPDLPDRTRRLAERDAARHLGSVRERGAAGNTRLPALNRP